MSTRVSIPKRVSEALNLKLKVEEKAPRPVSIPKRVSEALNLTIYHDFNTLILVSIPKRVSEALNLAFMSAGNCDRLFQSLKGFQRL